MLITNSQSSHIISDEENKAFKVYYHKGVVINDGVGQLCVPPLMASSVTPSMYLMTSP